MQQIDRAWLCRKIASLPVGTGFAAQAEGAERQERDPDDVAEDRAVLVPTDGGTGRVFGDKDLVKCTGCDFGEVFRPRAYDRKEVRDILGPG